MAAPAPLPPMIQDGIVLDAVLNLLSALFLGWFGVVIGVVVVAGISLIVLYFTNTQFRIAYNLFVGAPGRHAQYGHVRDRRGNKTGRMRVQRSGWSFDEDSGRWRYVDKDSTPRQYRGERYGRSYTRYRSFDDDD